MIFRVPGRNRTFDLPNAGRMSGNLILEPTILPRHFVDNNLAIKRRDHRELEHPTDVTEVVGAIPNWNSEIVSIVL